jgi:GT2 family glycosyltransferase
MISFIVPARNNSELTSKCLFALEHSVNILRLNAQFILIDDCSDSGEGIIDVFISFKLRQPRSRIIRFKSNQHYTGVFTIGIYHATGNNVFFLSNDMMITPSFLVTVLGVAALDDSYGIVRGTSVHTDSHPEHTLHPPISLRSYDDILRFSEMVAAINGLHHVEDQVLSGDAVLISRRLIDRIGVLDTRFFGYFGDIDYGLRAHLAGYKLVCAKGAWLHHDGAGHLKREAKGNDEYFNIVHARRMALVSSAYTEFRGKWSTDLPERYSELPSLHFFEIAERNADKVDLMCKAPASLLNEVEYVSSLSGRCEGSGS